MTTYVYNFADLDTPDRDLLGGKGADLAEMVRIGLPVPPGFTITTEACRHYLRHGEPPARLAGEISTQLQRLEQQLGRELGNPSDPLLVSVRSGAAISMPGMMDTILDIGLNDRAVEGLARRTGDERFALDSYRRLLQMFGETVYEVPAEVYAAALGEIKALHGVSSDHLLEPAALRELIEQYQKLTETHAGRPFPQDPLEQLDLAVTAVFRSWKSERAVAYRRHLGIAENLGTAVNIQAMVFGNLGERSGAGVCFTRDPETGALGDYGEYLPMAQGEDVVSGIRDAVPLAELRTIDVDAYRRLRSLLGTLERHYRDVCDVEFTIEDGHLWILQTRIGKRSAAAAFQIASDLVDEGWIGLDEALLRVNGDQLAQLMFPSLDTRGRTPDVEALGASPGSAVGRVALDSATAAAWAADGDSVVLVREETRADDLPGMLASKGILTSRGGRTSHAAVVARGLGRACVCGATDVTVDLESRTVTLRDGTTIAEGDTVSLDGSSGAMYLGSLPVVDSAIVRWLEGDPPVGGLVDAVARLMAHADDVRRLRVRANADSGPDAARAVRFGAEGIGLCRTEHMFLGERRQLIERMILADDPEEQSAALAELLPVQRGDFAAIFASMDGRPVTIRLIDPPLHEFLPDLTELSVRVALDAPADRVTDRDRRLLDAVRRHHEDNPMMGLRGVRLAIMVPDLVATQARAIFEAAADHQASGGTVDLEILVPLLISDRELAVVRSTIDEVAEQVREERGASSVEYRVGAMIETPRAALIAGRIAALSDFLSFGTNDLTQMTWGLSRDDGEGSFLPRYLEIGVVQTSPFQTIDVDGVGRLVATAAENARRTRPEIELGVCGEHGGDPASIGYFDEIGLDYVSCSPFRVPVARLEAGRAAIQHRSADEGGGRP